MKEDVQYIFDELVDQAKEKGPIGTFYGVPVTDELSKDELLAIISYLAGMVEREIISTRDQLRVFV